MEKKIEHAIKETLHELGVTNANFVVEYPRVMAHGDFSTNVALSCAKLLGKSPRELAEMIRERLSAKIPEATSITVEGPGFINITLRDEVYFTLVDSINDHYGENALHQGARVVVEYTDPNPFKEFHIGHLFPNTVGESIARLYEAAGAVVARSNYQGDVGMHVAKAIWGMQKLHAQTPKEEASVVERAKFLGASYAAGATAFEEDSTAKAEITEINKKIYSKSDTLVDVLYRHGRRWSLEYFEYIYALLGTRFDHYFFESETAPIGLEVVREHTGDVFTQSENAIVFHGEPYGLHTRVFVNSEGLPTYEAKELGLAKLKYERFPYDRSIIVTANEVADYFQVLLKAIELVYKEERFAEKTVHVPHGMMRLTNGKISSRKGNVPTALNLIDEAKEVVMTKIDERRGFSNEEKDELATQVAIGAIKFAILRQEVGGDIVFDFDTSLSFDGDSGPYLQYTVARINSLLERVTGGANELPSNAGAIPRLLERFPSIVRRAEEEHSPHHIAGYLISLAREFNAFYANTHIEGSPYQGYYLSLGRAVRAVLVKGMTLMSIPVVSRM